MSRNMALSHTAMVACGQGREQEGEVRREMGEVLEEGAERGGW